MQEWDWAFLGDNIRSWLLSTAVSGTLLLFFGISKKTLIPRLEIHFRQRRTQFEEALYNLFQNTKTFFVLSWCIYTGLSLHSFSPLSDLIFERAIFLISILQLGIWSNSLITLWIEHHIKTKLAEDAASATRLGLVSSLTRFALYGFFCLLTLKHFGVDITALIAGLGVGGIAVALATQNILGDLFASLTIVLDKPFVVGDLILAGELMGTVERIGLKTTRIRSVTGEQLVFPNGDLLKSRIRNFKRMEERRATFLTFVGYETPYEKLKKIPHLVEEIIRREPVARFDRCTFRHFGQYGFEFETVYWVKDQELSTYMRIQNGINMEFVRHFRLEGIEFAHLNHLPKNALIATLPDSSSRSQSSTARPESVASSRLSN